MLPDNGDAGAKLGLQIDASLTASIYSEWNNVARGKIPQGIDDPDALSIGGAVKELRKALGYSQLQLAQALDVSQGNIAKWETGKLKPPGKALAILARLAPEEQSGWWLQQAGVKLEHYSAEQSETRSVPVLKDAAAAGTPRVVDENEIDYRLKLPRQMLPKGGNLVGIRVEGDSMSPILESGYIAIVDVAQHTMGKLVNQMVAAREGDGVTLKWLRQQEDLFLLVPQNTSSRHPVRVLKAEDDWSIIGAVVTWVGFPSKQRK